MTRLGFKLGIRAAALGACLSLVPAASALGAERFAAHDGTGGACTEMAPCHVWTAIDGASDSDIVTLLSEGTDYNLPPGFQYLPIDVAITVRGEPGLPRPTITTPSVTTTSPIIDVAVPGVRVEHLRVRAFDRPALEVETLGFPGPVDGSVVRDVYLEATDPSSDLAVTLDGASTLERAEIQRRGTESGRTLELRNGALLRDSFVLSTTEANGTSIATRGTTGGEIKIRNVTMFGTVGGLFAFEGPYNVSIRNSIIDGASVDIEAVGPGAKTITVTHSNLRPDQISDDPPDTVVDLVPPNQDQATVVPMVEDSIPPGFDFHQVAGSPTINAGSPDAFTGAFDIDGQPRTMGTSIDIGGDEFLEATPAPPGGGGSGGASSLAHAPSNLFDLGKLLKNKKKGIAFLLVSVPGPGELGLAGKGVQGIGGPGIARKSLAVAGGEARLRVAPAKGKKGRKVRSKLRNKGKAKLRVRVTYVPSGGTANTQAARVKLVKK